MTEDADVGSGDRRIPDAALAEAQRMTGVGLDTNDKGLRRRHCWNTKATVDAIRQFAHGFGDDNPLFTDPEYATDTAWGSVLAPPTWLYTVDRTVVAPKLPGVQWIHGGNRFEFERPVRPGDRFYVEVQQTGCERKRRGNGGEMVLQEGETKYFDQGDDLVATAICRILRIPRPVDGGAGGGDDGGEPERWTEAALEALEDDIMAQSRRGAEPRYWDTVSEGDTLEPRLKGPLSLTDILCWYAGYGTPLYNANEMFVRERRRHPGEGYRRADVGIYEHAAMGHLDTTVAADVAAPRAYDVGPQRITWLLQVVTDWMGDAGFVRTADARIDGINFIGDLTRCNGTITDTRIEAATDAHLVDIELEGVNQDDEVTITGTCTVQLPPAGWDGAEPVVTLEE
jgi:acyl dehydratase